MRLFGRSEKVEKKSVKSGDITGSRPALPRIYENAPITLQTPSGDIIGRARVASYNIHQITLSRMPGDISMPEVEIGAEIYLLGQSDAMTDFVLSGVIYDASRLMIDIRNLDLPEIKNKRVHPRYIIDRKAEIFNLDNARLSNNAQECQLLDISIGGAKIRSNIEYLIGRNIRLRVELYDKAGSISFNGQIVRAVEVSESHVEYGVLFAELDAAKRKYLTDDLKIVRERVRDAARK